VKRYIATLSLSFVVSAFFLAPAAAQTSNEQTNRITMEQRHVTKEMLKDEKVESAAFSGNLAVGDEVPESPHLHPIPAALSERVTHLKNYRFALHGTRIVLIDTKNKVAEILD
jgi:hypothetical protein